ncbi:MAG TPA: hypothetical protein VJ161_10620 [Geobacteraceae bacterium]|jgi:hypothetical protein|nr:hypothetical protein [Geobacteraceae bacterium]
MEKAKRGFQPDDLAGRAEYDRLLRHFRAEEEKANRDKLLFGDEAFGCPPEKED